MTPRRVKYSNTFHDQLLDFIIRGELEFGERLASAKRHLVLHFIETTLANSPAVKPRHPKLGVVFYPISNTPFIVVYDYDDQEVRILACLLKGAGARLDSFDPGAVDW